MAVTMKQELRFGPFVLDVHSAELYKGDSRLKIQPQPIQVLGILLEHPGELVTRDEIRSRIWPSDTFVDFDHGLNTAVKKLRQALEDESETPKYIETLPRRGYRFIGEMTPGETSVLTVNEQPCPTPAVPNHRSALIISGVAASLLLVALTVLGYRLIFPRAPRITKTSKLTHTQQQKVPEFLCYLATDGSRVYFQEHRAHDQWFLSQVSTSGGETSDISIPTWRNLPCLLGLSPSASEILISDCCPVKTWTVPLPAGPGHAAPIPEWGHHATWTPDGKGFLYVVPDDRGRTLTLGSVDGKTQTPLFSSQHMLVWPRVSPDGKRVRWTVWQGRGGGPSNIWEANIDGSNPHLVFPEMKDATLMGDWTTDGDVYFFYYRTQRPGTTGIIQGEHPLEMWTVRENLGRFALRRSPTLLYAGPLEVRSAVSGRNSKELYAIGADRRGELSVIDSMTSKVVPYLNGIQATFVTFSPDRQWIAYVSYPDGSLWKSRVDGTNRMQMTFPPMGVTSPRWSPDGKLIVFVDLFASDHHSIFYVPAEGGRSRLLLTGPFDPADPTWSPDSQLIAYGGWSLGHIEILDLRNMQSAQLPGSEGLSHPVWSPDGKYLVAHQPIEPKLALYSFVERKWRLLSEDIIVDSEAWSRDSRYVYAHAVKEGRIIRVDIENGKIETVTDLAGVSWTQSWFGLTPEDQVMILRNTGSEEIYKFTLDY